ncbi:hypothetical protein [Rubrivirga sp. IMCC45206]|uniref:hypothetical protein n=1 Tax=Rubrivirga sp. IMCC45206 TaxID=3391614 RepID=UPI00398FC0E5
MAPRDVGRAERDARPAGTSPSRGGLGPRPDGSGYGPDDLGAVADVAGPVGRALRVGGVRETGRAAALDALRADLYDGLRALQAARAD